MGDAKMSLFFHIIRLHERNAYIPSSTVVQCIFVVIQLSDKHERDDWLSLVYFRTFLGLNISQGQHCVIHNALDLSKAKNSETSEIVEMGYQNNTILCCNCNIMIILQHGNSTAKTELNVSAIMAILTIYMVTMSTIMVILAIVHH